MSDAAHSEATQDVVTTEWLGETIEIPASTDDWDIDVLRAFSSGDVIRMLEMLVGRRRFSEVEKVHRAAHGGKFLAKDLQPLTDKIAELYGFDRLGE